MELNSQMHMDMMKAATGVFNLVQDATSLKSVFDINDGLRNSEAMQSATTYLKSIPEMAALISERYVTPIPDLKALLALPKDTLGYVYAAKMTAENFDPNFYRPVPIAEDLDYIRLRTRHTHDIWHAVTGFDTDSLGEVGLQAFGFSQMHYPSAVLIMTAGLISSVIRSTQDSHEIDAYFETIYQGYQMGRQAKLFLAQKWEEGWDKPLAQWREELNVKPAS
ncbi:hypothetical protein DO97_17075 [Neosynechococcus sphagnicola sy1]|uniref:Ubiquinone biosynthesis protein n=1 Tax=Neosynechococcus sphagnicola sy1 TaxID=1497020 RepID=A0A098THZ9_9CYAN|nr:Coq4 family protein [Neosynechococcus sphagnicola]KGF71646.1 hypothetical protein DO97_17075 [Neosynechococcus sphagnicola sy1]